MGPYWEDTGLVFTSTIGTVIEPRNLARTLDHLIVEAGVRRIRFHDLRHTCASLLLAQGVPPRVVMDVLGHSQISITMDLYSHVMPSALRDAADAMDRTSVARMSRLLSALLSLGPLAPIAVSEYASDLVGWWS